MDLGQPHNPMGRYLFSMPKLFFIKLFLTIKHTIIVGIKIVSFKLIKK